MQPELLLNYYDYAEIRYAIAVANGTFKLILATVRLLPKDKPVSYTSDAIRSNHGDITMIARKVVLKAELEYRLVFYRIPCKYPFHCL